MSCRARVMAIDPSLTGIAVSLWMDNGTCSMHEFSSSPASTLVGRINRYRKHSKNIEDLVKEFTPELIVIEGYSYGSKGRSFISIAEFGGVLRNNIIDYADSFVEVAPSQLKKFVTGKGNAKKALIISVLSGRYGIQFDTDNKADAFGLMLIGKCILGIDTANKVQRLICDEIVSAHK